MTSFFIRDPIRLVDNCLLNLFHELDEWFPKRILPLPGGLRLRCSYLFIHLFIFKIIILFQKEHQDCLFISLFPLKFNPHFLPMSKGGRGGGGLLCLCKSSSSTGLLSSLLSLWYSCLHFCIIPPTSANSSSVEFAFRQQAFLLLLFLTPFFSTLYTSQASQALSQSPFLFTPPLTGMWFNPQINCALQGH